MDSRDLVWGDCKKCAGRGRAEKVMAGGFVGGRGPSEAAPSFLSLPAAV